MTTLENTVLENKIDFAVVVSVKNANPNGDPLNENNPRTILDGRGEISDVCIKRKIRNRLQDFKDEGKSKNDVYVLPKERAMDNCPSLKERAMTCPELKQAMEKKEKKDKEIDSEELVKKAVCAKWIDVRSFGQIFPFGADKKNKKENKDEEEGAETTSISIGIRGPVSLHPAFSINPVETTSLQIVKCVDSEDKKDKKARMGMKHRVDFGLYVFYGSINCQLAEKTGFTKEDAVLIKEALRTLFENDCSAARPDGSMEVCKLIWWEHNCKTGQYSSAKVHRCLQVKPKTESPKSIDDYEITVEPLDGLKAEIIDGL